MFSRRILCLSMGVFVLALAGCGASMIVKDKNYNKVGFPYYLPRPYLAVTDSFVVDAKYFLLDAELSQDGNNVIITSDIPPALSDILVHNPMKISELSKSSIATTEGAEETPNSGIKDGSSDSSSSGTSTSSAQSSTSKAPIELRKYFEIIYLPDFDEKYYVSGKANLGTVKYNLKFRDGWMLEGVDADVDNSKLAEMVTNILESTTGVLLDIVRLREGLIAGAEGEAGTEGAKKIITEGQAKQLTLLVTRTKEVIPGIYPFLKENEWASIATYNEGNCIYYIYANSAAEGKKPLLALNTTEKISIDILLKAETTTAQPDNSITNKDIDLITSTIDKAIKSSENKELVSVYSKVMINDQTRKATIFLKRKLEAKEEEEFNNIFLKALINNSLLGKVENKPAYTIEKKDD
jgi:hypothetical protein